jgi:vacuolar protein sorting-associated protein VTA1
MASSATGATFRAPPGDLKALAPFLQRAFETRTADPALSYWCNYHAAQMGIPLLSSLQPTSKSFLMELMDTLESQKKNLAGNDVVHGDDIVAKAYVENVALKVFAGADNEDRTGRANKGTAKKFLAAANFIDVLSNFGPLENTVSPIRRCAKESL